MLALPLDEDGDDEETPPGTFWFRTAAARANAPLGLSAVVESGRSRI